MIKCFPPHPTAMLYEDRRVPPPKCTCFLPSLLPPPQVPITMTSFLDNCHMLTLPASILTFLQSILYLVAKVMSCHLTAHCLEMPSEFTSSHDLHLFQNLGSLSSLARLQPHWSFNFCSRSSSSPSLGMTLPGTFFCLEHSSLCSGYD